MFLYHDLFITTTVAVLMGRTEPYPNLIAQRPKGSLLSNSNLFSLTMQIALTAAIQLGSLLILMVQPWYEPVQPEGDEVIIPCWEVTCIFSVSSFQYLILALAFSYGPPYRQPFYTNILFLIALVVLTAFTLILTLLPIGPLADFFEVMRIDWNPQSDPWSFGEKDLYDFRGYLLLLVSLHLGLALLIENLLSGPYAPNNKDSCRLFNNQEPRNKYKIIERQMDLDEDWPPLCPVGASEILSL